MFLGSILRARAQSGVNRRKVCAQRTSQREGNSPQTDCDGFQISADVFFRLVAALLGKHDEARLNLAQAPGRAVRGIGSAFAKGCEHQTPVDHQLTHV